MAVTVDQIRKAGHSRLPLGEGTRRLIDLEEDIHQKRCGVKIDGLAPAGAGGQGLCEFSPGPCRMGVRGKAQKKLGFLRGSLGRGLAGGTSAGKSG